MNKFANDTQRIELYKHKSSLQTKISFKWPEKARWYRECLMHIFQWFKTCWCLKEISRAILCLEGVLFYFSFHTASIWNKSPWVYYILKTLWKTFIGPSPHSPDHITLAAQHIPTRIRSGALLRWWELFQVWLLALQLQEGRISEWARHPTGLPSVPKQCAKPGGGCLTQKETGAIGVS